MYVDAHTIHDGLPKDRHVRINTPNIFYNSVNHTYESHGPLPGNLPTNQLTNQLPPVKYCSQSNTVS